VYIAPQADTKNFPGGKGGKRLQITTDDVERLLLHLLGFRALLASRGTYPLP